MANTVNKCKTFMRQIDKRLKWDHVDPGAAGTTAVVSLQKPFPLVSDVHLYLFRATEKIVTRRICYNLNAWFDKTFDQNPAISCSNLRAVALKLLSLISKNIANCRHDFALKLLWTRFTFLQRSLAISSDFRKKCAVVGVFILMAGIDPENIWVRSAFSTPRRPRLLSKLLIWSGLRPVMSATSRTQTFLSFKR